MPHIEAIRDESALKEYGKLALTAIQAGGGRSLIRTSEIHPHEQLPSGYGPSAADHWRFCRTCSVPPDLKFRRLICLKMDS
jgi:hypothetical protein